MTAIMSTDPIILVTVCYEFFAVTAATVLIGFFR